VFNLPSTSSGFGNLSLAHIAASKLIARYFFNLVNEALDVAQSSASAACSR